MLARRVVLSDSPSTPGPRQLLFFKHHAPATPLVATLTRPPASVHGSVDILGTGCKTGVDEGWCAVFSDQAGGTMAEVGLLPFARVAFAVAQQILPAYRSRFSKHQFTQPQLLAVLCLLRYEDWTFREAETRLREHQELRAALQLAAVPDYTTLYRFLRRLQDDTVDRGLSETVRRFRRRRRRAVVVAVDGTGLSYNSVSSFFIRRVEQQAPRSPYHRHWLKWVIVVDVQQQILLAQRAHQGPGSDVRYLPGLLDVAARGAPIRRVLADAEFDSEPNHQYIRQSLGAESIIPAKRRGVPNGEMRNLMFRRFPAKPYRQRVKIESTFSAVKRKLSSRAPGRSLSMQIRHALLLGLAFNLYRLRHPLVRKDVNRVSVDSKRLTVSLSPLDATLTKFARRVSRFRAQFGAYDNFPANRIHISSFLSHSCALLYILQFANARFFNHLRTLGAKTLGVPPSAVSVPPAIFPPRPIAAE